MQFLLSIMNRFTLLIASFFLCFGAVWSQQTHWMARSVFDVTVINFNKDLIMANLTLNDDNFPAYTGVNGEIELKEDITDTYEVMLISGCIEDSLLMYCFPGGNNDVQWWPQIHFVPLSPGKCYHFFKWFV